MSSHSSEAALGRAQVYFALADALMEPQDDLPCLLAEAAAEGAKLAGSEACETAAVQLGAFRAMSPEALSAAFRQAFSGSGGRPIALYESLHRHGRLAGEATADVAAYYQSLGISAAEGELPDHASVELAFLGELAAVEATALAERDVACAARIRTAQRSFLRTHVAMWLPDVGDSLRATGAPLYATTGALLRNYLAEELSPRRARVRPIPAQAGTARPVLPDPSECTLCGLCTGACPPGALWIAEDDHTTRLMLDPARCTGCERCAKTCPEQALHIAQPAEPNPQPGTLATSPRVTCPQCGQPTVSQAELQAVFRRLQPDLNMQRRFSLCIDCKSMI